MHLLTQYDYNVYLEYVHNLKKINSYIDTQNIKTPVNILGFLILEELTPIELTNLIKFVEAIYTYLYKKNYKYKKKEYIDNFELFKSSIDFKNFITKFQLPESKEKSIFIDYEPSLGNNFLEDLKEQYTEARCPVYHDILKSLNNSEELKIHCISMASPGIISFEGIGEIIKEIRELIKDLSYRNHYEALKLKSEQIQEIAKLYKKIYGYDRFEKNIFTESVHKLKLIEASDTFIKPPTDLQ